MCEALYIHIPFCINKCGYCDFLSFSTKEITKDSRDKYVHYLKKELDEYKDFTFDTVYFGGGTPSLLSVEAIGEILEKVNIAFNAEVTIEANPNTLTLEKLKGFYDLGINRISIGVQSFNPEKLKVLQRIHSREQAIDSYFLARKAGFKNISLDLIFATPKQTLSELREDLEMIKKLNPEHLSIYSLIWEEGTKFMELLKLDKLAPIENDLEASMYEEIIKFFKENNYSHYEISNFSKEGYEGRHNSKYWKNMGYVGVGLGASGFLNGVRYRNYTNFSDYYKALDSGSSCHLDEEVVSEKDHLENQYILGLRLLKKGISNIHPRYQERINKLLEDGYLKKEGENFLLTSKGLMFANDVFLEIME